eukprot:7400463-Pyramimonas_sp.AAC.1
MGMPLAQPIRRSAYRAGVASAHRPSHRQIAPSVYPELAYLGHCYSSMLSRFTIVLSVNRPADY